MSIPSKSDTPRRKALNHFQAAEERTNLVKQLVQSHSDALDARTAKLRALRLAKEEADRAEAARNPAPQPAKKKPVRRISIS
jgi:hypothetical protein